MKDQFPHDPLMPRDPLNPYHSSVDPMQRQLATTQRGLWIVFVWIWKALVFSPLLVAGYWIASKTLTREHNALIWLAVVIGTSAVLYFVLLQIKQLIIDQKRKGNWMVWIPVFAFCIAFTCLLPAYLIFDPVKSVLSRINAQGLTYIFVIAFSIYVYCQYDFLNHFGKAGTRRSQ